MPRMAETLQVSKLTDNFGVVVEDVDLASLDDKGFAEFYRLWKAHGAMLVRGQQALTDARFEAFSRRFGELDPPPVQERGRISPPG